MGQMSQWTWLWEGSLPGNLAPLGEWLCKAETLLGTEEKQTGKPDEVNLKIKNYFMEF